MLISVTNQVLGGHEGPVSCLCFSPVQSILASASWDRTIRLWDMLDSWQVKETLALTSDGKYRSLTKPSVMKPGYLVLRSACSSVFFGTDIRGHTKGVPTAGTFQKPFKELEN